MQEKTNITTNSTNDTKSNSKKDNKQKHISFSVSAGAYPYLMGVACYLQEHYDLSNVHFSGASGGTFPALLLAAEIDLRVALEVLCERGPNCCKARVIGAYGIINFNHYNNYNI